MIVIMPAAQAELARSGATAAAARSMRMPFLNIVSLPFVSSVIAGDPALLSPIGFPGLQPAVVDKFRSQPSGRFDPAAVLDAVHEDGENDHSAGKYCLPVGRDADDHEA